MGKNGLGHPVKSIPSWKIVEQSAKNGKIHYEWLSNWVIIQGNGIQS